MTALTLILGNKNYSSWSLRPWLLLRHFNVPFEEIRIPLFCSTTAGQLAEHSPSGKVPVLKHDDLVVWDSLAICEYISENFLDGNGWPKGREARAVARSISAEMHAGFYALRNELPMNCRRQVSSFELSDNAQIEIARIKTLWNQCRGRFAAEGEWLCGEFSIADCMYAPVVVRLNGYGVALEGELQEYADRVIAHPGMQEWIKSAQSETEIIDIAEV